MGDENLTMEEMRRQLEEMRLRATTSEAALREEERLRLEAEAAQEAMRTQGPQNAHQYMHPTLRVPEPALVLPEICARNFEIKPNLLS